MRRIILLKTIFVAITLVLVSLSASAQESPIYSTGFESADGFTSGSIYNNSTVAYTGTSGSQWGTYFGTPSTTSPLVGSQSMQMRWYTTASSSLGYTYMNFNVPNVTKVTFNAANTAGINLIVSYSTDNGVSYTGAQTITLSTASTPYTYTLSTDPAGFASPVRFKFQLTYSTAPTGTSRLYLDNVVVYGIPPATPPAATPLISTGTGNYWSSQNVTITCSTPSSSIYYTLDGTAPTNACTLYTGSIPVNSTTAIRAIAYASGYTASQENTSTLTFPTPIANVAALRATSTSGFYKLIGEVLLTYQSPGTYAKPKFIQDATGGVYIYDASGKMTTNYNVGDGITGLIGTISLYNGYLLEFMPVTDAGTASSTGNTITPKTATLATLANYPSQLVTVKNVTITGSGNFVASTNYPIYDISAGILRTAYTDLPYVTTATAIPSVAQDITGIVLNNGASEVDLVPRTVADFAKTTVTAINQASTNSSIYSSNGSVVFSAIAGQTIEIYNAVGQKLVHKLALEGVNAIQVSVHGVVLVKVGNSMTKVIM